MAYKTIKRVSVPNLKLFGPTKTELWTKNLENFVMWENGPQAFSCPPSWLPQYKMYGDFQNFEQP